jgi:hypothetical protein
MAFDRILRVQPAPHDDPTDEISAKFGAQWGHRRMRSTGA